MLVISTSRFRGRIVRIILGCLVFLFVVFVIFRIVKIIRRTHFQVAWRDSLVHAAPLGPLRQLASFVILFKQAIEISENLVSRAKISCAPL
jgi:hypothetical protein